jgi:16S rRNA (guanine527-N7)-methyltransferase
MSRATPLPDPAAFVALTAAGVEEPLAAQLAVYAALVLDANRRLNLTGAKDGTAFAEHLLDALTLWNDVTGPLIDIGSGNGIPGIPLALATGARVVLLEPIKKRATFLTSALAALGLDGEAVAERAEDAARNPSYREAFQTATARAVSSAPTVAELTVPFLAIGGRALLQRGALDERERNAVADAALVLGAELLEERPLGGERRLVILEKRGPTSFRFPRKNGVPAKRPLCLT